MGHIIGGLVRVRLVDQQRVGRHLTYLPLSGDWEIDGESITSKGNNATLTFKTYAKDVYVVAAPSGEAGTVNVSLRGADSSSYGSDALGGSAVIDQSRLYHIVSLPSAKASTVTLKVPSGITLYTFTFGS